MKRLFAKWLSALLIASLLMTSTAIMEEELPVNEEPVETFAAEPVEEEAVPEETIELSEEEALPAFEADVQEEVVEEEQPDETAKLMAGEGGVSIDEAHFPDPVFRDYISTHFDTDHDGSLSEEEIPFAGVINLSVHNPSVPQDTGIGVTSLKGIEFLTNLNSLTCSGNNLGSLDLSGLTHLSVLNCVGCNLSSLNVRGLGEMFSLACSDNQLTALDLTGCTGLQSLNCSYNQLTALDVSGCTGLTKLACHDNKLASLNIDGCNDLANLECTLNKLTALDVTRCPGFADRIRGSRWNQGTLFGVSEGTVVYCDNIAFVGLNAATNTATGSVTVTSNSSGIGSGSSAIVATKSSVNVSVTATPGSTVPLDLGGASAKSFKSSNKKIASVNKNGVVTFKKAGKVKITYKVGKKTRKVTLNITDPTLPTSVTIEPVTTAVKKGDSVTLTATLSEGANSGIKWTSSNKKVAAVNKGGTVTFKKAGKVTITATTTRGKKKARVTFTVSK